MTSPIETRASLLIRIRDRSDHEAWLIFHQLYQGIIVAIGRRQGLQEADANDVAQLVLMKINESIDQFTPDGSRAKFRTWLYTVTRNAAIDHLRRIRSDLPSDRAATIFEMTGLESAEGDWSDEQLQVDYRREVYRHIAERVQSEFSKDAWLSFQETLVGDRGVAEVASELNKTVGAVYASRARVLKRFRQLAFNLLDDSEVD